MDFKITSGYLPDGSVIIPQLTSSIIATIVLYGPQTSNDLKEKLQITNEAGRHFNSTLSRALDKNYLQADTNDNRHSFFSVTRNLTEALSCMEDEALEDTIRYKQCLWVKLSP